MTDLQVKYMDVLNKQQQLEEQKRANIAREQIAERENAAKYGYTAYTPYDNSSGWNSVMDSNDNNRTWQYLRSVGDSFQRVWNNWLPTGILKGLLK